MIWGKRFVLDIVSAHIDAVRAIVALPWFFALVIAWEFAQHIMEIRIGFFDSRAAASAVAATPSRMLLGWVKELWVYIGGFLVIRQLVGRRGDRPVAPLMPALRRYLPYIAYSLFIAAIIIYANRFVPESGVDNFRLAVGLGQMLLEPALMLWMVSAATDGRVRGPLSSTRQTGWLYLYALPLFYIGRYPTGWAHQALNIDAIGQPRATVWAMLTIDAIVVGLLIAVVPAIAVRVAHRIGERRQAEETPRHITVAPGFTPGPASS
jgi:hypothetical protein